MLVSAINTVEIRAAQGRASEVGVRLSRMLDVLNSSTPCTAYTLTSCQHDDCAWIVSGYWPSEAQMQAHFSHPELNGFMALLNSGAISQIQFNSFTVEQKAVA
ncbi:antibiotic biosynthesis monooxygenase [Pseudomonas sp. NPDC090202]|uniref:antibiotic biosynthesis monooxygenase n=1 Tax=unclassified Pseudomonas TaxID=196821 RepID=UPI00381E346E